MQEKICGMEDELKRSSSRRHLRFSNTTLSQGNEMQCDATALDPKELLQQLCEKGEAVNIADMYLCLEQVRILLADRFHNHFVNGWNWHENVATAQVSLPTSQCTAEDATNKGVGHGVDDFMPVFGPPAHSGLGSYHTDTVSAASGSRACHTTRRSRVGEVGNKCHIARPGGGRQIIAHAEETAWDKQHLSKVKGNAQQQEMTSGTQLRRCGK